MPEKERQLLVRPNERMWEMLEAIKAEKGLKSNADVVFFTIGEVYHKLFPVYQGRRGTGVGDPAEIGRRKVEIKKAEDEARTEIADAERANICTTVLHGKVLNDIDGKFCVFNTFQFDKPDEQRVPLEMITDDFARHQNVTPNTK